MKIEEFFNEYGGLILAAGIVIGFILFFVFLAVPALESLNEERAQQKDCVELVRCIDLEIDRNKCDELYPKCRNE